MRLNFQLKKINISPVVHIQILRHADEFENKYASGELYGALYDDEAQVTNILPFPEKEKMQTKEDLQTIERRYDQHLVSFNLDQQKLGWYLVCYQRNFWDELQSINFYQNYINTSFFLVFDYKARQIGANPYKAYRLKDQFALTPNFTWADLQKCNIKQMNPFVQIPIQVKKNELFEGLMHFNKQKLLKDFEINRKNQPKKTNVLKKNIEQFLEAFEEQAEIQKKLKQNYQKTETSERVVSFRDYSQYLGQALKLEQYEAYFKKYEQNLKKYGQIMQSSS